MSTFVEETPRSRWVILTIWLCRLYLVAILAVWATLSLAGDVWWPATVLLYMPRWIWAVPLVILVPVAARVQRRQLGILLAGFLLLLGPVMGMCLPWRQVLASSGAPARVRVLSLNIDRHNLNAGALDALIHETDPDIVALQDWTGAHDKLLFQGTGWYVKRTGQFYLGSRLPITDTEEVTRPQSCVNHLARYRLETPHGPLTFFNVRLETPRQGLLEVRYHGWNGAAALEKNSDLRRTQSEVLSRWVRQAEGRVLVAGDFNTLPDSPIWREYWRDFTDAWTEAGVGLGHTYINNRTGLRIDHQLAGPGWQCRSCRIGPSVGSEHRPLIADWEWIGI